MKFRLKGKELKEEDLHSTVANAVSGQKTNKGLVNMKHEYELDLP